MEEIGPTASLILFFVLLLVDMFFYGFGAAITQINVKDVEKRATENQDKKSIRLGKLISSPAEYINTLQLIVTIINMIMGAFYLGIWRSVAITFFFLVYILLTFGVLLPKKLASRTPEKWAYACINLVYYITIVLTPLTWLVTFSVRCILKVFGMKDDKNTDDVTEEEIISMVNEGHEQGILQASEAEMITNIFEFADKEAQDIMTHRKNVVAIDAGMTLKDAIRFMLDEKNSRYPVYEENMDHIIGILHLKDAMRLHGNRSVLNKKIRNIEGLIREAKFIPKTRLINELFNQMQEETLQMVIVIDEYGQTEGLVAMEDILEEIVGNIMDEYDVDEDFIEDMGNDEYEVEGMIPLEELEEELGIVFDVDEFETLNGFLISKLEHIPEEDEVFDVDYGGYNFKILSVKNMVIQKVLVAKLEESEK